MFECIRYFCRKEERTITNAYKYEKKVTHVFVIKDGSGLEEESHMRTTITAATAVAATISLSIFFCRRVSLFHICEEQRKS